MKHILILLFSIITFHAFAQMPPANTVGDYQWSSNYATGWDKQNYMSYYSNTILYVHEDSFSNVISVGITTKHTILKNLNGLHTGYDSIYPSDKIGQMGGIITKYDCAGTVLWSHLIGVKKSFSSAGRLYMADALTDEGGNTYLYICCESADFLDTVWFGNKVLAMPYNTYSPGDRNIMAKIDANGNIAWTKDFQDDFLINSYSLCPFQNNQFISSRCTGTDMYDIGKGAHMLSLLNDTIHFLGRIDSSLILFPNIASNRPTCEWPAATLQPTLLEISAQSGSLLNKYQFVPRKYLGDTTLWPLLDYIANFENLGHGEFRAIVFISPIGPNKNMWDSIPPTPFLDAILLGRNFPYYIRGGAPEDSYRRYFSLTFTKTHLISINFLGDSVAIIDAESHPNMPRYELLVSGSRNTKILGTNFALKSKVKWNELWQQNFINQGTPYWASPAAVTESEGVLQVGKNDQLNRIIQTDSSNFEFFRSVASIKNPIASIYSMESDDPTLTTTLPAEVEIQGYKITTSNLVGQGGLIQFDGNSGQIINQNISNKQLSRVIPSNYVFPMWHYSEIYQSEKGNIYYYGHLLGGWKITISGDDTTKGQSSSNYPFPDADALLIKFGNKCGINSDTVTVAPLEPSWLSASCSDETGIVLKWDDNSHTEIGYKIYRAVNKGSYTLLCTLPANSKGYTDHLVIPASTYHYKVYAYNRIDTSFAATVSKTLCYADGTENINPLQTNGRIYPNPSATNHFTVLYNATQNETAILRVVSLNGALLYESKVAINPNANSYEVVLPSTTPAGTYLVSLIGTQTIYQDKVVLVK